MDSLPATCLLWGFGSLLCLSASRPSITFTCLPHGGRMRFQFLHTTLPALFPFWVPVRMRRADISFAARRARLPFVPAYAVGFCADVPHYYLPRGLIVPSLPHLPVLFTLSGFPTAALPSLWFPMLSPPHAPVLLEHYYTQDVCSEFATLPPAPHTLPLCAPLPTLGLFTCYLCTCLVLFYS